MYPPHSRRTPLGLWAGVCLVWALVAPMLSPASAFPVATPEPDASDDILSGRELAFQRALRFHYGADSTQPDAFAAFQSYEDTLALGSVNDTRSGAALCGMAILLETGGGRDGNLQTDLLRAVSLYNQSARLGNATAQFAVAVLYNNGILGFPHDEPIGMLNLYYAALGGEVAAQMAMGFRHLHGFGVPKKCATAVTYYELAANAAVDQLAASRRETLNVRKRLDEKYLDGFRATSAESRDEELVNYYVNTADSGDVKAQVALGQLHYYGAQGVTQNLVEAAKWFELAAAQGDPAAQADLGHMYLHGMGVDQDTEMAKALFGKAAEAGVAAARNGLGYMYLTGVGLEHNPAKAKEHFKTAAEAGNADAMFNLGLMYLDGRGVRREFSRAQHFFSRAGQRSHLQALHKMAQMHVHGVGTTRSCQKAVKLFMSVARRGPWVKELDTSYHRLLDGQSEEAFFGYAKAAEQGYEVAQWNAAFLLDHGLVFAAGPDEGAPTASSPPAGGAAAAASDAEAAGATTAQGSDGSVGATAAAAAAGGDAADGQANQAADGASERSRSSASEHDSDPAEPVDDYALARMRAQERALRLFLRSSQQGHVEANLRVGDYYYYGLAGLAPDMSEAATHYHAAADMRNPQAMFNLGYMHEHGYGMQPDHHLAKRYYDMAQETHPKAYFAVQLAMLKMRLWVWWENYVDDWQHWYAERGTAAEQAAVWPDAPSAPAAGTADPGSGAPDVSEDDDAVNGIVPGDAEDDASAQATHSGATAASGKRADSPGSKTQAKRRTESAAKRALQRVRTAFGSLAGAGATAVTAAKAVQSYAQAVQEDELGLVLLLCTALVIVLVLRWRLLARHPRAE